MHERPKTVWALAQRLGEGTLLGALAGVIAGGVEYLRLGDAFTTGQTRAYWNVMLPHLVLGTVTGLVIAAALALVLGAAVSAARAAARTIPALVAVIALAYAGVWIAFEYGATLRLVNAAAFLVATALAVALGIGLARTLRPVADRADRRARPGGGRSPAVVALTLLAVTAAVLLLPAVYLGRGHSVDPVSAGPSRSETREGRPNVLFILIDALRADHLPMYGYSRDTAPNLAALARQGMTFTQAYAQASYTRASVATILTALYPSVHKATEVENFLPGSVEVLPEALRRAGYATFGISSNANVSPTFGYSRGFDVFRVWKTESEFRLTTAGRAAEKLLGRWLGPLLGESADIVPTADAITDATVAWASAQARQPFFMYVHYIDPHDPYRAPAPFDRSFDHRTVPPRRGGVDPLELLARGVDRDKVARALDQYDGEIRFADHHVRRLLDAMGERGLLDNTLVIVTADHGEEFFEHGNDIHGRSAYEEVIRVPLIAAWPGRIKAGVVADALVGHIDLMPTLLDLGGAPAPPALQGRSFAALLRDPASPWPARPLLAQVNFKGFSIEAIRDGQYKYVRHPRGPQAGREELYDLQADPLERTNLVTEAPARTAALKKTLDTFNEVLSRSAANVSGEQVKTMDRDTERALRSLGYIK